MRIVAAAILVVVGLLVLGLLYSAGRSEGYKSGYGDAEELYKTRLDSIRQWIAVNPPTP